METGKSKTEVENRCPFCKKGKIVTDPSSLEDICDHCGSVISVRREALEPEWRRVGLPITLTKPDMGLATYVGKTYGKRGKEATAERRIARMRELQRRMFYYKSRQRSLAKAIKLLSKLSEKMHLPRSVTEGAVHIYRRAVEKRLIKGRTIAAMVSASLYAACRDFHIHRTLDDISNVSGVSKERIARNYRILMEYLDLEAEPLDPAKALSSIAAKLSVTEKTKRKALQIIRKAQELSIAVGKNPMTLAAAALYIACILAGERRTQKDVAHAAEVSDVSLRVRSKELQRLINRQKGYEGSGIP
jgi:transcription initiation factor TFIIB